MNHLNGYIGTMNDKRILIIMERNRKLVIIDEKITDVHMWSYVYWHSLYSNIIWSLSILFFYLFAASIFHIRKNRSVANGWKIKKKKTHTNLDIYFSSQAHWHNKPDQIKCYQIQYSRMFEQMNHTPFFT